MDNRQKYINNRGYILYRSKTRYHTRKSQGLCVQCGWPNDGPYVSCTACRKIQARRKRKYRNTPKGKRKAREQRARRKKRPSYKEWQRNFMRKRYHTNIQFRLTKLLRARLREAMKSNSKGGSAVGNLGCSIAELKTHLENQFESGMTWENHGNGVRMWNIDHILPLSSFDLTDPGQLRQACHYTNLQPLWYEDNMRKGSSVTANRHQVNCKQGPRQLRFW